MSVEFTEPVESVRSPDRTNRPNSEAVDEAPDVLDSAGTFQAALEAEVARRIEAAERRWQSRKDRELNRARRRWESEAGSTIDPELLAWISETDPHQVGQWLKAGLAAGRPDAESEPPKEVPPESTSGSSRDATARSEAPEGSSGDDVLPDEAPETSAAESGDARDSTDTGTAAAPDGPDRDAETPPPAAELELEAAARDRLAERRSRDSAPDLFSKPGRTRRRLQSDRGRLCPGRGGPGDVRGCPASTWVVVIATSLPVGIVDEDPVLRHRVFLPSRA